MKHLARTNSGEVSAEAPSGHDPVVWTETDIKRLDSSLAGFFGPIAKPPEDERECNPSRGIILGVVIGLAMWAGLVWLVVRCL